MFIFAVQTCQRDHYAGFVSDIFTGRLAMIGPNLPEDHVEPCNLMDKGSGVEYCLLSGETKNK